MDIMLKDMVQEKDLWQIFRMKQALLNWFGLRVPNGLQERYSPGVEFIVFGKPGVFNGMINIIHPEIEPAAEKRRKI